MGNKKKRQFNILEVEFEKISRREDFWKRIREFRVKYGIPLGGFSSLENINKWYEQNEYVYINLYVESKKTGLVRPSHKHKLKIAKEYIHDRLKILRKYHLPITGVSILSDYIFSSNKIKRFSTNPYFCEATITSPAEAKANGQGFVMLKIYYGATRENVDEFLDKWWKYLKKWLLTVEFPEKTFTTGFTEKEEDRRRRKYTNSERDQLIYEFYQKSNEELGLKPKEDKANRISSIMKRKGYSIGPEAVKQIYYRQKRRKGL